MTLTTVPLPANPLPDLAPCSGLWELFDSRRREDHWKARQICVDCPLRADCAPPRQFTMEREPGRRTTKSAPADGTWGGLLYHSGVVVDSSLDAAQTEACPTCGATALAPCRTRTGRATGDHKDRHTPRVCARCGRLPTVHRGLYCKACRAANDQDAKNIYLQRRRRGAA